MSAGSASNDQVAFVDFRREHRSEVDRPDPVERGFTTFKESMIYESEGWQSDDRALFGTLEKMKEYGTMLLLHAESALFSTSSLPAITPLS